MRAASILIAALGVAVAGGSVVLAARMSPTGTASAPVAAEAPANTVLVLVANSNIGFGAAVELADLTSVNWPKDNLPEGAFTTLEPVINPALGVRRAKQAISMGEILVPSKLSGFGEAVTVVNKLGPNARAVAIQVDAVSGVGGFVAPGDFVDVLMTQGDGAALQTMTILQNVAVVGVDQSANAELQTTVARTITVEVSPQDSQKLALAQRAGALSLTLRSQNDAQDQALQPVTMADILGPKPVVEVKVAEPVAVVPPRPTILVRRGNEEAVVSLDAARVSTPPAVTP
jgi:pilus assembly protein CpaB